MLMKFLECSSAEDYFTTLSKGTNTTLKDNSKDNPKQMNADQISRKTLII
jgi:hypothetical protein